MTIQLKGIVTATRIVDVNTAPTVQASVRITGAYSERLGDECYITLAVPPGQENEWVAGRIVELTMYAHP